MKIATRRKFNRARYLWIPNTIEAGAILTSIFFVMTLVAVLVSSLFT